MDSSASSQAAVLPALGLAVALGVGLLIGTERERRKGQGDDRDVAGVRSFAVAAVCGALAQSLPVPGLVVVGALLVAVLVAIAYFKSRTKDPGVTTEMALFATYLIGVQAAIAPALGAACGAGLAALLAARSHLHRFATELLSEQELHDGLLLVALALILLPLVPTRPMDILGGINPRPLAAMVLLILAMQAGGQVALRRLGPRGGPLLAGLVSGFVSSTACIASLGSRARTQPQQLSVLAGSGAVSASATWLQALMLSAALSPGAAWALLPSAFAGAVGAAAFGAALVRHAAVTPPEALPDRKGSALRPREAILVALVLAGVTLLVGNAQRHLGDTAGSIGVALAALLDPHASIAALAALHAAGRVSADHWIAGVLVAIAANTLTRCVVAAVAGGKWFAARIAGALACSLALASLTAWWTVLG
ncbi:putative membrane protein [Acidovorax sp. CF316]|uniref:MgtC/SapB family protein n=1 Tax=Acidovorax sp. CF316 TaxID=1144317 RepID=UPI00026BEBC6|nr:MgtC/SapB family protein [Acidovorax sp. CF316]EJE54694.1 putative membrane protein [Acidovorax sp. CF316]